MRAELGRRLAAACGALLLAHASLAQSAAPLVELGQRIGQIEVVEGPDGARLAVPTAEGRRLLTPADFGAALAAAHAEQRKHGWLYVALNITSAWGLAWVAVGVLGQALFFLRMVVQWLASERERRSVVPPIFWWSSLLGGILLLVYFVWRKDAVGILGQSTGVIVYARNLVLLRRRIPARRPGTEVPSTDTAIPA